MKYVLIAGIVIIIGFLAALSFIPIGIEPLTEVYFENHTKLPSGMLPLQEKEFAFSVHNLEYRNMNYSYEIKADYLNVSNIIGNGKFELANNQTTTINQKFSFNSAFERARISVNVMKDNNESIDIHFWVDDVRPRVVITPAR